MLRERILKFQTQKIMADKLDVAENRYGNYERGYPLHTREAIRAAERRVRENGLAASGIDPRRLRKPSVLREAA